MYYENKAEERRQPGEYSLATVPVKPETTVTEFKREIAGRKYLSAKEKAERFADEMPLDVIINE
jgi:hypothetical protein